MKARFLLQPFTGSVRIGDALSERADGANGLWILAAWAHESGLKHLQPIADQVRARGGRAEAILGLDQGFATYKGLRLALKMFDVVYVFHDGDRTFHPKLYVIEDDDQTRVVVGSGNATTGGLYNNFEAAVAVDLDRTNRRDKAMRAEIRDYFDAFIADGMPFLRLDRERLNNLRDGGVLLADGDQGQGENLGRLREQQLLRSLLGEPVAGLPKAPSLPRPKRPNPGSARPGRASNPHNEPLLARLLEGLERGGFTLQPRPNGKVCWIKMADSDETVGEVITKSLYLRFKCAIVGKPKIELEGRDTRWPDGRAVHVTDANLADCLAHFRRQASQSAVKLAASRVALSRLVSSADIRAGRIRFPSDTARLFPAKRETLQVELRGFPLRARYNPRPRTDTKRSAELSSVGKANLERLVRAGELLIVSLVDGVVRLD